MMKRPLKQLSSLPTLCLLSFLLLGQLSCVLAQQSLVGRTYPSEKRNIENAEFGYDVTQWTQTGSNNHLYFNMESFIDEDNFIFYSDRSGRRNLFKMNLLNGTITQMTDEQNLHGVWHLPQFETLWFLSKNELKALNTNTLKVRSVSTFDMIRPESFAVTCDRKYVVFAANKNPGFSANHSTGPFALFRLDLQTNETMQISPDQGFMISHVLTNPVDPKMVSYCWQHVYREDGSGIVGNTPNRIWWNNVEGTNGGPLGIQEFGLHRTHEFWFPNGKHMGYSARYHFGPNEGKQFIGIISADGKDNYMMAANVSAAHSQVYSDGKHWVSDQYDGPYLVMFTIDGRQITKKEILFRHDSSWEKQSSHPHPHFSPNGKYVLFTSDKSGKSQVYTVKVNIGK